MHLNVLSLGSPFVSRARLLSLHYIAHSLNHWITHVYIYMSPRSLSLSLSHTHTQHKGGLSLASLLLTINPIAYGSGAIGLLVGPYAVVQEKKITETEALRQTNKKMAEEVGILKEENERLSGQINRLEDSVKK